MSQQQMYPTLKCGMTLIEVMIAMAVLAIGIMGVMSGLISVNSLENSNHEEIVALNIARGKLAEIQTATFGSIFSLYGPNSASTISTFSQLDGGTVTVVFPTNSSGALDETVIDTTLGMPQDLNGNGSSHDTNVSTTYTLLPVRITVDWKSSNGARQINLNTMLTKLK